MTRPTGNLRTLGVLPCGACRAYVRVDTGCSHFRPRAALPAVMVQPASRSKAFEGRSSAELWYAAYRLADSKLSRTVVQHVAAAETPDAGVDLADKNWRDVANRLCRTGLMELSGRGGTYRLTDHGREIWKRAQQL